MSALLRLLGAESGLSPSDLTKIIATAPDRYKRFRIPKRTGGFRDIAQPARELKMLQRILVEHVLDKWPIYASDSTRQTRPFPVALQIYWPSESGTRLKKNGREAAIP